MALNSAIEVTQSFDGTKLYIKDKSLIWGGGYISKSDITGITVTFSKYSEVGNILSNISDWISTNVSIEFTSLTYNVNDEIILEITSKQVNSLWNTFPDGIYYIQYNITNSGVLLPPDNNDTYIASICLIQNIQNYRDELFANIAQNITCKLEQEYFLWYAIVFNAKLDGLKTAISTWNLTEIRNGLAYLQSLQTKYPTGNDIRLF